ncbi:hypothetical protein AB1Y20_009243 [Prymnesium parvum]|uniref:Uncharacterized protein n=1 Tax=Prymnesium parvum TaxID=97485 RepID=A0AB34K409_PRYPA
MVLLDEDEAVDGYTQGLELPSLDTEMDYSLDALDAEIEKMLASSNGDSRLFVRDISEAPPTVRSAQTESEVKSAAYFNYLNEFSKRTPAVQTKASEPPSPTKDWEQLLKSDTPKHLLPVVAPTLQPLGRRRKPPMPMGDPVVGLMRRLKKAKKEEENIEAVLYRPPHALPRRAAAAISPHGERRAVLARMAAALALIAATPALPLLTSSDYDEHVYRTGQRAAFVFFFAPDEPRSEARRSVWEAVARELEDTADLLLAAVDCGTSQGLCERNKEHFPGSPFAGLGLPRLLYYLPADPTPITYEGLWTVADITSHVRHVAQLCDVRREDECSVADRLLLVRQTEGVRLKHLKIAVKHEKRQLERANFRLLKAEKALGEIDPKTRKNAYKEKRLEIEKLEKELQHMNVETRDRFLLMKQWVRVLEDAGVDPMDPPAMGLSKVRKQKKKQKQKQKQKQEL